MAVGIVDRQKLVNIADAVRAKKGITGEMTLDAIASNITSMPTADNNAKYDFTGSGSKSSGTLLEYLTTIDLTGLDTSSYTSMERLFNSYNGLTSIDLTGLNTSKVTSMYSMFSYCSSLTNLDLSGFDTSKVKNMWGMFQGCSSLESLNISSFDTSEVQYFKEMFERCNNLKSIDVSNFNTSKSDNFYHMFDGCKSLTSIDISNFDFSNSSNGEYYGIVGLFYECSRLKTIKFPSTVSFNNTNIYFKELFRSCSSLESLDLTGWNTTNVVGMNDMFNNCSKLSNLTLGTDWASNSSISSFSLSSCPLTRESALDVINKLATRSNSPVITFSGKVGLYQSEIDVATNKGWSVSGCRVLVEAETATVGQYALIDGVISKCVYVADTAQSWGQRIFVGDMLYDSNGKYMLQWGGYEITTGITATAIGTGLTNTNALLAMNLQSTDGTPTIWDALDEFRSTHSNRWFIPSRDEGLESKKNGFGDIWTSSEYDANQAYITFDYGSKYTSVSKAKGYRAYAFTYV